jgi:ABC-type siderophore export system fused ATPase/permease subunit
MKSGHLVTFNILWVIFAIFALVIVQIFKSMMQAKNFEVDEDLPNFFETITLGQADMIVNEEKHC